MQDQQKQLIAKLKEAQNVLVTVSKNPSVDQLSAAIGLTLALNKLDKHATAVFSGQVPSTIEFLKPEETLEKTTDSLRDFIIALDKSKADKLRYKVEDQVVRIFITPYRTSISEKDLDFSQGDFNVDVVVALGVPEQQDLDAAIQAHGRILHDATVAALSVDGPQGLGTLNLSDPQASSLSEMVASLIDEIDQKLIDSQIATALLTGIVATTNRFSNDRTKPKTMTVSSVLMSAGANQQLIATELETPEQAAPTETPDAEQLSDFPEKPKEPGMLEIEHDQASAETSTEDAGEPMPKEQEEEQEEAHEEAHEEAPQIQVDEDGQIVMGDSNPIPEIGQVHSGNSTEQSTQEHEGIETHGRIIEPPSRGSALTANTQEEGFDATTEELTLPPTEMPMMSHDAQREPEPNPEPASNEVTELKPLSQDELGGGVSAQPQATYGLDVQPDMTEDHINTTKETLVDIERAVDSPHLGTVPPVDPEIGAVTPSASGATSLDDARSAVEAAINAGGASTPPNPITALNAQPLGPELHDDTPLMQASPPVYQPAPGFGVQSTQPRDGTIPSGSPGDQALDMPIPSMSMPSPVSSFPGAPSASGEAGDSLPPPPPVPPPPIFPS